MTPKQYLAAFVLIAHAGFTYAVTHSIARSFSGSEAAVLYVLVLFYWTLLIWAMLVLTTKERA